MPGRKLRGRSIRRALDPPHELYDLRGRLLGRTGVERRLRVVLDAELDRLGDLGAGEVARKGERHVDAGRDAGGGDHLALFDHTSLDRPCAELGEDWP